MQEIRRLAWVAVATLAAGFGLGALLVPPDVLVAAETHMPVPLVDARCEAWLITETAHAYYWDTVLDSEVVSGGSSSTADYFTVDDLPERYGQGATAIIPPKEVRIYNQASFYITWWDSDRPGAPEPLMSIGVNIPEEELPACL